MAASGIFIAVERRSEVGQTGCAPATTECFDEQDACFQPAAFDVDIVSLIIQYIRLPCDDL